MTRKKKTNEEKKEIEENLENKKLSQDNKEDKEIKFEEEKQKEEQNSKIETKEKKYEKHIEEKPEIEREYIINLRKKVIKVPRYRRAKKAIRALKEFLARHMKVEKRDIKKVKIDKYLNEEIWHKGIRKPIMKLKIRAKKIKGIVYAELAEMPKILVFKKKKEEKLKEVKVEKIEKKEDKETKEKEISTIEAGLEKQKKEAKEMKHNIKEKHKKTAPVRMALQK
ncbi:MAG: 50S ribosomal protein L31e [Candidatus Pacearchaeota archaeon]